MEKLTSVKVIAEKYQDFQLLSLQTGITFVKLVRRSMELYLTDANFRSIIHNQKDN